jgi:serine/threonine protein kinase/Tol biopolymer transport system component
MTANRAAEIRRICQEALERPSIERARFLSDACAGDESLRREIEALLAHDLSADRFLATPAFEIEAGQLAIAEAAGRNALVGNRLGTYEILSLIGSGGMGDVYRAHDPKLGRDVAIKVLPSLFANDSDRLARLEREARLLAALNHPHIATIYGLEDVGSVRALVMELVEGPTLAEQLAHGARPGAAADLPLTAALDIARQLTEALAAAHDKGIVHRDLKPANIKVGRDGRVKVLDFGLAKTVSNEIDDAAASRLTTNVATNLHAGVVAGTPAYLSPEQARGRPVDTRADIWAFGCVLFEMLAGRRAFSGETVSDTIVSILERAPDWNALPAATPPIVRRVLAHCLEKDPTRRWRDIGDVRIALDDVEHASAGGSVEGTASATSKRTAWAAALIVVTVGAAALATTRLRDHPVAAQPIRFHIPATVNLATSGNLAVSPDGRNLAFIGVGADGAIRLWLRAMDSLELRPLPGSEMATVGPPFFWSPDSRSIAFDAGGALKRIAIAGGPPQTLCTLPGIAIGGSWNRNGDIIVGSSSGGLLRVPDTGGSPTPLTSLDPSRNEVMHLMPTFLSDGRHFVYLRVSRTTPDKSGTYIGTLDAVPAAQNVEPVLPYVRGVTAIPSTESRSGRLLFLRGDALMAQSLDERRFALTGDPVVLAEHVGSYLDTGFFSASANGVLVYRTVNRDLQVTWFGRQGGVLATASDAAQFHSVALSPDGSRAIVSRTNPQDTTRSDLWLIDLTRDNTATRFTFAGDLKGDPAVWSRDGSRIAYGSGDAGLYEKQSSGTKDPQVLVPPTGRLVVPCDWSPDGRFFLYAEATATTRWDLWIMPLAGDRKVRPLVRTPFDEEQGRFAPDGRHIAYVSNESGVSEVYVREFSNTFTAASSNAGAGILVSKGGGASPRWRADGKELFYVAPDGRMMAVEVSGAGAFQSATPHMLFQMPPGAIGGDVTPDGKRFLLATPLDRNASAPFTVVLNWTALVN